MVGREELERNDGSGYGAAWRNSLKAIFLALPIGGVEV